MKSVSMLRCLYKAHMKCAANCGLCHGYAIGVLIFPNFSAFSSLFYHQPSSNPVQALAHVICTWHPCASSHATLQDPAIITWLMRHQPALITCLHSRPCFWTLGPRPLSIVPTISTRFRLPPIWYHLCKFSHWATYALGIPIAIAPLFHLLIPNRFPIVPLLDNDSHVAHCL